MDILGLLKAFIAAMTGAFLAITGLGTAAPTATQVQEVASTTQEVVQATDAIVEETVATTPSPTSDDVRQAYELGKTVGKLEAATQQITSQPTTTMTQAQPPAPAPEPVADTVEPTSAGVGTTEPPPEPPVAAAPVSQARIEIAPVTLARPLDRTFVHVEGVESVDAAPSHDNWADIAAFVYGDDGQNTRTATVVVTATDASQNATFVGTGNVQKGRFYFPFNYLFKTAGQHTVTFTANGLSESVTMTAE